MVLAENKAKHLSSVNHTTKTTHHHHHHQQTKFIFMGFSQDNFILSEKVESKGNYT